LNDIHIIGDSHCLLFEGITPHWFDASTAYNLWKQNKAIEEVLSELKEFEEVWFCFGWVDCQRHIYGLEQDTGIPQLDLVEQTVTQYTNYIKWLSNKYKEKKIKIMLVPPAGFEGNDYNLIHFPDRQTINEITQVFNWMIKLLYEPCVDIWGYYEEPWPKEDFKEDKAHIKNEISTIRLQRWLNNFNNSSML
jgi:hypothetical protein